ncbi:hypothetical protein LY90DRAFT_642358 [Neocallimastix californiae]|jgi:hypothetical protein|uniref:FERM domain-containing protein n=1 Tax=Neocallimastix californiae TaxID=1754190 RepID=A0A1Y2DU49_9FUNG|nr:hypothetical protein LY90DRAFT_642358 [Neocallimastix californiae]|eukprot:ORY62803.1 hypothetical protein LY90DRAFT_642358 [Neocallimastix californiae]
MSNNTNLLRVFCEKTGNSKALEFDDNLRISELYEKLNEKFEIKPEEGFLIYRPSKKAYLNPEKTLYSYEFANEEELIYKNPIRMIKIKMMDNTTKIFSVNESEPIYNILDMILDKLKINLDSKDEYGIAKEEPENISPTKQKRNSALKYNFLYSNNTKWLDTTKTLCYEDIGPDDILILKKKLFFTDERLNRNDNVQINLIYNQIKETIISGSNPCTLEEATLLAAIQCQIQYGDCDSEKTKANIINPDECLPPDYRKHKKIDKLITEEYYKLKGLSELNGKFKYIQMCRSLKTYGTTFFLVKEKNAKKKKLIPILLGVTKNSVLRVNPETKEVMEEWQLKQLKNWKYNPTTFSIDFGQYREEEYVVETDQGCDIAKLINDYIKLLTKMKNKVEKKEEEGTEVEEVAEVVEVEIQNSLLQHKVEIEVKKININDYIDLLNTALIYLSKSEECILQMSNREGDNIYSDKTYYQNYKTISNDVDISTESIKKLSSLSKDNDIEGICNKILNVASLIEEITTLVVFDSQYLITNNLVKNPKIKEKESSLLMKNYYFKNIKEKDIKNNLLYSIPDTESISSLPRDDSSLRSFDEKTVDIKGISNNENYKLIVDKIFLPEIYKITMHSKYVIESLKEALISNNETQRYTILSIDTRIIVELLNKLKIIIYENIPGKSDCNAFIKKISEVKKSFTQLQESIKNETITIENNEDDEINIEEFDEHYIDIVNCIEKSAHTIYDLSKENYVIMISELRQFQDQFCELHPNSYKVCVREYNTMKESLYLKKYILFLNTLSLYINNIKRMYGDYSNLSMEDDDSYENVYGELQSLIDILKRIPKKEITEGKKEVVETLAFYNEVLSDSDLARLNKMIEVLNNCPKLSEICPNDKGIENVKENILKLQTLSNFMIILGNCINEIYKFYEKLDIPNNEINDKDENTDNSICEIDYDTKDKLVLYDILDNFTFKFSDITIELFDLLNNDEFKHASNNLFNNEADLYLDDIKKDLLHVIENEKKIINNEERHKNIWNDNIAQIENIQSVLFNLLAHIPKFETDKINVIYIIYKLQSIIKDLEENIILSNGELLNPIQRSLEFSEIHHKRVKQELEIFHNIFNELIELKSSEKALLTMIVKTIHIFEVFIFMFKLSVNSITCLDKENQKIILNSAKNTAISLNNLIIDKLGLTEQDIEEISLYIEDYIDISKYEDKLNISESFKEELLEEFNINMKDMEEKLNSTTNFENIILNNVHTLYQNINNLIEDVKSSEDEKYTIEIGDYETLCNVFRENVIEINSNYSELNEQMKIYKMCEYYMSFKLFSNGIKFINTVDNPVMKDVKKEIIELYNMVTPINIRLKVDIISLIDEHREVNAKMWESLMNDVLIFVEKMQSLCSKSKENQTNVYTSSKIQKLNGIEKYFEHIYRNNRKELEILNSNKFYHGDISNIIYYMVSNTLCSVFVYMTSLMNKCHKIFSCSCNSPMESQMYQFDDNWCELLINSFMEVNETIKSLSNIIHKNTSYVKNIHIHDTLKRLYNTLNELKYLSSKKYLLNHEYELWSQTAAENAIRSVSISLEYMEEDYTISKYKLNMTYIFLFYLTFAFYLLYSVI